jgi:hypothetical protein
MSIDKLLSARGGRDRALQADFSLAAIRKLKSKLKSKPGVEFGA